MDVSGGGSSGGHVGSLRSDVCGGGGHVGGSRSRIGGSSVRAVDSSSSGSHGRVDRSGSHVRSLRSDIGRGHGHGGDVAGVVGGSLLPGHLLCCFTEEEEYAIRSTHRRD